MKTSDIAAVIERDLLAEPSTSSSRATTCFSCGRGMIPKGELRHFCSERCRDWFDAGNQSRDEQTTKITYRWRDGRPMRQGPNGFYINCANCQKEFDSNGLRCCSVDCERRLSERRENLKIMAEVGDAPNERRRCGNPRCIKTIPTWRKGRRVRSECATAKAKISRG
jgi:predicted nucleic acid-binding Zn ribbon protein